MCRFVLIMFLLFPSLSLAQTRTALLGDSFSVGMAVTFKADLTRTSIGATARTSWERTPGLDKQTRVFLMLGTNDMIEYGPSRVIAYQNRLREILTRLADQVSEVILIGPPCMLAGHIFIRDSGSIWVNQTQQELVEKLHNPHIRYVSLRPMTLEPNGRDCSRELREPDRVHFTAQGYDRVNQYVKRFATSETQLGSVQ